jgi:ATP-binding cassette subfamily E protein 1
VKIAVVFEDKCHPDRCNLECMAYCPPMRTGTEVIWLSEETGKAVISEETCIACGICIPAGIPVSTSRGVLPIEAIEVGDLVLTHRGRYRPVRETHHREYSGPLFHITVAGQPDDLVVTEDHPILAVIRPRIKGGRRLRKGPGEQRWVHPHELKVGDYLVKPRLKEIPRASAWNVSIPVVVGGGRRPTWGEEVAVRLTPGMGRLVGHCLAEGSADDRRVTFSFHRRELAYLRDVENLVRDAYGVVGHQRRGTGEGRNLRFDSAHLARVLGSLGKRSDSKHIPPPFMTAGREVKAELVKGIWRGDGYQDPKRSYFTLTTSPHLAYQVQEMLAGLGIAGGSRSSWPEGEKRVHRLNIRAEYVERMTGLLGLNLAETRDRTASHYGMDGDYVYMPISQIEVEHVEGLPVFNLEVQEDETYVAAGAVVHNCVKKCPFDAIRIIGLPDELEGEMVHRYGRNKFRLFRLPVPKEGRVMGLLGPNGIGKTTVINILSGNLVPNVGEYEREPSWDEVLERYAGTELHGYLRHVADGEWRTSLKPQYVDMLPRIHKGEVRTLLEGVDERGELDALVQALELEGFLDHDIRNLSGGELQRTAIAATLLKDAHAYFLDEPSSYLDIYQRLRVARVIHELSKRRPTVVVEHDLAILDFLADVVYLLYGEKGAYGIVAQPRPVRTAINVYLSGYLKEENIRFRDREIRFESRPPRAEWASEPLLSFSALEVELDSFVLTTDAGAVKRGEVVGIVGPNATGKTTFVKVLAGMLPPRSGSVSSGVNVSYKPQYIRLEYEGSVRELLLGRIGRAVETSYFKTEIAGPLELDPIMEKEVNSLSGGEQQRVSIALCLGREADIYLLDEPSAYLDSNQRMQAAKALRRAMENAGRTALVVDHDVYFVDMVSDSIMVFTGVPAREGHGSGPFPMRDGMNRFLKNVGVTFRRDLDTKRPRINKPGSKLDRQQKSAGEYYYELT